ncbi:uncharacterized protein LOC125874406 isoform X2 [Solanum stenotomum]|uniref:uncharacterized protein LOC125874406 isoform X2 n=1 Tax=Solanum stenotomum TaxID=172797 RepID=UPI0020D064EB|nr:uncharacterized protein LOC125874406 isoform X2 [Solanum stenotomum]
MGLNEVYGHAHSQILMMNPLPSVGKAYAMIMGDEGQRTTANLHTGGSILESTALYAAGKGNLQKKYQGKKKNWDKICDYCKIQGHIKEDCFRLIGYPADWKFKRKSGPMANQAQAPNQQDMVNHANGNSNRSEMESTDVFEPVNQERNMYNQYKHMMDKPGPSSASTSHSRGGIDMVNMAGIVVAGAAGVILVTVLTFAALCIGKRNSTRVKHQREPLTVLQEMPMASDNHDDTVEDGIFLENSRMEKVLQALPGMVLVPAAIDQVQGQALAALQVLKVIEADVQPGDLCTRREYARWLVSASSVLSRTNASKVYPAMYIENVTELAFDDITLDDPDFPSIQGLAEAGLISSKLSRHDKKSSSYPDQSPFVFTPESPLSRQDLVSWKMALEKRQLPVVDQKSLQKVSGWIDTDKIHPDAWPALVADLSSGEWGIMALAFGYTRLFQPYKPVTKGQAAIALATGEASDTIVEELSRIEAESIAEKAVASYNSLAAQVEKDVSASFEKELILEKKRVDTMKKLAEEARQELESLRAERKAEHLVVMKERAAVDSELEVLSRFRHEVEEQLQSLKSDKIDISYEKERLGKLHRDAEIENQEIARLQFELEVERKALSIASCISPLAHHVLILHPELGLKVRLKELESEQKHWRRLDTVGRGKASTKW